MSIIVPVHNMATLLENQLRCLQRQQTSRAFEVVVVDNCSTDQTRAVAEGFATLDQRFSVVGAAPKGINVARNRGIECARGEHIALCDADDEVEPGWLEALAATLRERSYVGGALRRGAPNTAAVRARWDVERQHPLLPGYKVRGAETPAGANCYFSKSMWREVGGFDETLGLGGDETEFFGRAHSAGYRFLRAPDAVVGYRLPSTVSATWRRAYRYGRNGSAVLEGPGPDGSPTIVLKQWVWLVLRLPLVLARRRGVLAWVHVLAKRCGQATYRMSQRAKTEHSPGSDPEDRSPQELEAN